MLQEIKGIVDLNDYHSRRESMSLFRKAPLTLRIIDWEESSLNLTQHWVTRSGRIVHERDSALGDASSGTSLAEDPDYSSDLGFV
ncbi:hypothetical protein PGTUg99_003770 [Puccinia graminis f. sp. tritici]|uniref:Uncharacterized protein n=1 Tax=Puccinia graminis f. sp. tritici TaxID=56615 RepID=A0A5B0N6Y6_PUCGR|nr:hypothetical protein PGTUg99_003770 [Puccinia graminis f. sp. tritici]